MKKFEYSAIETAQFNVIFYLKEEGKVCEFCHRNEKEMIKSWN